MLISAEFSKPEIFSVGKNPPLNEDKTAYSQNTLVLSDGATDKTGLTYDGKSGGDIAAEKVVEACLDSDLNGKQLVDRVTARIAELYKDVNPRALSDSAFRFSATMVCARIVDDRIVVTQVGDSAFRVNADRIYQNKKAVDDLSTFARRCYVEVTGDVDGSRNYILPLLKEQHHYQNNSESPLGYGTIDGSDVPEKFIKVYSFDLKDVDTVELVSDGYYGEFPDEASVESYEKLYQYIEKTDPDKVGEFASTGVKDDRTVLISKVSR